MTRSIAFALGGAAVLALVALVAGSQLLAPRGTGTFGGMTVGGSVEYQLDGGPASTRVDAVAGATTVSGTAVTTLRSGTHAVRLACAARDGDTWAFAGTTERTTVPGGRAGNWSAVIVRDGSPQRIGIWLSDDKSSAPDCESWLASTGLAQIDPGNFQPVTSGELVQPPDLVR